MRPTASQIRPPDVDHVARSATEDARALFDEHFERGATSAWTTYQQAPMAIQADHTHYSEGFALFAAMPYGVAIAARRVSGVGRVAEEGAPARVAVPFEATPRPDDSIAVRIVRSVLNACTEPPPALNMAIVDSLPDSCQDAYAVALARAVYLALNHFARKDEKAPPFTGASFTQIARAALPEALGLPYSTAYPLAVSAASHQNGRLAPFLLVDTPAREVIPVPSSHAPSLQWGFFDAGPPAQETPDVHYTRKQQVREALDALQQTEDFADLASFNTLEHRSLDRALNLVGPPHQAVVRHLVTENRRVQKHVVALRHGDGQMTGALLHMTHTSLQTVWQGTTAAADFLVQHAEQYTEAGLYGAGMTGRNGYVLTIGRVPTYRNHIETLAERYESAFHHSVSFLPL
ncbi:MAG: hypothetical protein PPP56_03275 [Longimonas sp.]|uniref:hypothetical protein n=1 Tax=Longimonas sp. TaxID=2039626 RepID=UPI003360E42C